MLEWIENHQIPCIYKSLLRIECPTCGFQKAFIMLLRGEYLDSLKTYPALIPTLFLLVLIFSWLAFRKPRWQRVKWFIQADLVLIFTTYIYRLLS